MSIVLKKPFLYFVFFFSPQLFSGRRVNLVPVIASWPEVKIRLHLPCQFCIPAFRCGREFDYKEPYGRMLFLSKVFIESVNID